VNSEERPPGRTGIINHLRGIVHAIGIRGLELQVGNGAQGKGVGLRVITRTGSLSWSTPSTGEEEFETREGGPVRMRAGATSGQAVFGRPSPG
jgi:hypothetical protein